MTDAPGPACPKSSEGWELRYTEGTAGWDLGGPPPALVGLLQTLGATRLRVLVPGCGNGHDAIAWAGAGHEVVALDFAPSAIEGTRAGAAAAGVELTAVQMDLFDMTDEVGAPFDAVWEQTCYCAIQPEQRDAYIAAIAKVLRPGGALHGIFWNHGKAGGPPFDISPDEVRGRFGAAFEIVSIAPVTASVPSRANENLAHFRRR